MSDNDEYYQDKFFEDEKQKESEEDIGFLSDEAIKQAVVTGTDWTTETILSQINKGNILLNPRFQRRDAWTKERKSKFIESLILGLPVPQLVLAESKDKRGKYLVLDGKQRLLSLRQFAAVDDDTEYESLKLSGLEIRTDINGKNLNDLRSDLLQYDYLSAFENQPIRTVIIKNWPNENFLYKVFLRLNTGSVSLSPQELRQALHPGPFVIFVDKSSQESPALRDILNNVRPDFRMRDAELLVRYYAFSYYLPLYKGNLKLFLDDTCKSLNNKWAIRELEIKQDLVEFEESHRAIKGVFGDDAYRKWTKLGYESRFNRAIFDIMMFVFRRPDIRSILVESGAEVVKAYQDLSVNDIDFISSIEQTTKSLNATYTRISSWVNILEKTLDIKIGAPNLDK